MIQGTIVTYFAGRESGMILAQGGDYYMFVRSAWDTISQEPEPGMAVVFETNRRTPVPFQAFSIRLAENFPLKICDTSRVHAESF